MNGPLVTVGMPTFNRPKKLGRALNSILSQTYQNIEVIVSDNASPDPLVEKKVSGIAAVDCRVRYVRHPKNIGAAKNFSSLLPLSNGQFFMWAADDDRWEPFFIERCVRELVTDRTAIVCQMEAQYELEDGSLFPFFAEGQAFYNSAFDSRLKRLQHLVANTFGNLVYGVFRREALIHRGSPVTNWVGQTLNEIPMQLLFAEKGEVRMLPQVGMYKAAPLPICEQARWEQEGGPLPNWPGALRHVDNIIGLHRYHSAVKEEVFLAVASLDLDDEEAALLRKTVSKSLRNHLIALSLRRKPRRTLVS